MSQTLAASENLAGAIGQRIRTRVGRRVRNVIVTQDDTSLVVRGRAASYHAWQLVIAECQAALSEVDDLRLDCVLRVEQRK
jgi:hypothetical protein